MKTKMCLGVVVFVIVVAFLAGAAGAKNPPPKDKIVIGLIPC